ncbi:MAG: radical SAM protein [Candidatus Omnitrophica bacterium]|nr:radical SAM protein [Candidatus Omnitrophota bacterium]
MNVLLIDPPYTFKDIGGEKENFKHALNIIPSLGLAYLAAVAEREGHNVKIIDCTLGVTIDEVLREARFFKPKIIGVTSTTPVFGNALKLSAILRRELENIMLILGGAHATACPGNALDDGIFDFAVIGEGEETFKELLQHISGDKRIKIEDIRGIIFKKNGQTVITERRSNINNLDIVPYPARHLLPPLNRYSPTPASCRKLPLAVIMTSRGCPNSCTFCDKSVFGDKLRKRSATDVISEVEEVISKYGAREIRFFDDTFTIDRSHVESVCKEMKKINISWTCLTAVNYVDKDILAMLKDSGCWQVLFGLESGDDFILEKLKKGNTVQDNRKAVNWAYDAGLRVRADFLVGSPWETKKSLRRTVDFAKSLPLDFAHFNKFVPFPGTVIYKMLKDEGYNFDFKKGGSVNNQREAVYIPPAFTESEYFAMLNRAYKDFYLDFRYILRRIISIRTGSEFIGNIKGAYSIASL